MRTKCPKCGYIQETYAVATRCRGEGCGRIYKTAGHEVDEKTVAGTWDGFITAKEMLK